MADVVRPGRGIVCVRAAGVANASDRLRQCRPRGRECRLCRRVSRKPARVGLHRGPQPGHRLSLGRWPRRAAAGIDPGASRAEAGPGVLDRWATDDTGGEGGDNDGPGHLHHRRSAGRRRGLQPVASGRQPDRICVAGAEPWRQAPRIAAGTVALREADRDHLESGTSDIRRRQAGGRGSCCQIGNVGSVDRGAQPRRTAGGPGIDADQERRRDDGAGRPRAWLRARRKFLPSPRSTNCRRFISGANSSSRAGS